MIVIDASTVIGAALTPSGIPRRAIDRARATDTIAMSEPVSAEIREVLARPKFSHVLTDGDRQIITRLLFADARWFDPATSVTDCRDPNDNKCLELALAAGASVPISSDRDLLALHPWRDILILNPARYMEHA